MKPRRPSVALGIVATFLALAAGAASCRDDPAAVEPCTNIPAGGCPLSHGIACEDPACEAVYACRTGNAWVLDRTCPAHEAGAPREASVDAADAAPEEASRPFDASVDAPPGANGGPGCGPLQAPDCSLGLALACPSGCCGCEDLYVCENGGWTYWATCKP
jgi:hypothetical protein